ncbi:MAG: UDP-N-acetylmuramoyl-tripeptide--D-alanyl-D-alanine ligase, partial [Cellulomonadaceae bacterium]|nr:UDP-N-acetylmuramoyl-tripeptide--D-alanyl-D-alanine ligase [Cellulomonadaceae bacterium]
IDATAASSVEGLRSALRDQRQAAGGRRTVVVVGPMGDQDRPGPAEIAELDGLGRLAVRLDVQRLVAVGPTVRAVYTGAYQEGSWSDEANHVPDADAARAWLTDVLEPGDLVLVGGRLEQLAAELVAAAGEPASTSASAEGVTRR